MFLRRFAFACVLLVSTWCFARDDATPGWLEGHLKIVSHWEVEPSDAMPRQTVTAERYAEYPLIVLTVDRSKQVARFTADENGNYRVALPPGTYVLDLEERAPKRLHAQPRQFTIVPNQSVRVDMNVLIGLR
jgi:hypothetical protein